eukprot:TRINITY_DN25426_c0_g1_i1.p1 TRINITY_DN25426_c0_g1~~TRINITY_DN25426_c0_g1_i1.p1  ORF type:complete len:416 (+),score=74.77 TRINITY_DN25426_c0_g1_i1:86-1249(+)
MAERVRVLLVAVLAALGAAPLDAKGTAAGARAVGGRPMRGSTAYYPLFFYGAFYRPHYRVGNRVYSPGYGSWGSTPGWAGNGTCDGGNGTCPCPEPNPEKTKKWVWVQVRMDPASRALSDNVAENITEVDVNTFEVDAFLDIASRVPCRPPTQLLVLKFCKLLKWEDAKGGLADDQLMSSTICQTVGDEATVHSSARMRHLLQSTTTAEVKVMQFVVGAESEEHGNLLHKYIRAALTWDNSTLRATYNLPPNALLSMETETPAPSLPLWATILIVSIIGICYLGCCMGLIGAFAGNCDCCQRRRDITSRRTSSPPPVPVAAPPIYGVPIATATEPTTQRTPTGEGPACSRASTPPANEADVSPAASAECMTKPAGGAKRVAYVDPEV